MTRSSPFDPTESDAATHLVLANALGERSLWPCPVAVPAGWVAEYGPASYAACLRFVEAGRS
ncbi:MbtH family NRPS accessory protein [Streptomyces sp. NPDC048644]|uniref:MbtH family NRPS accessory protein n=1 Tax=Streptomyces sp. NPDC048644 TaxID=3365582 RepID=UPI003714C454